VQYYISLLNHTRIQDFHTLLTELELNSQFHDLRQFVNYGSTGEATSTETETDPNFPSVEVPSIPKANSSHLPPQGSPGLFLINLAVLAATTRLCVEPWNKTTGYLQFIALHHWHPSFSIASPLFLQLVQTELHEGCFHNVDLYGVENPFDLQDRPPSAQPASPFKDAL
jgi:hypothetical protein